MTISAGNLYIFALILFFGMWAWKTFNTVGLTYLKVMGLLAALICLLLILSVVTIR